MPEFDPFEKVYSVVAINCDKRVVTLDNGKEVSFEAFNAALAQGLKLVEIK